MPSFLEALGSVRGAVDATQRTIDAIKDLREPIDVEKLGRQREQEEAAWRDLESAWRLR